MKYKRLIILIITLVFGYGQNLQLHYDFGKNRRYLTSTIEMYKPDPYGATFFFVDMDYDHPGTNSMSLSYFEIARYVTIPKKMGSVSVTLQYNDGVTFSGTIDAVWLGGVSYPIQLGAILLNTDLLYRHDRLSTAPDIQLTMVWSETLLKNKISLCGFLDIWTSGEQSAKNIVIMTEPQLWYNLTPQLSLGSEVEVSRNFISGGQWAFMPTLGLKWSF